MERRLWQRGPQGPVRRAEPDDGRLPVSPEPQGTTPTEPVAAPPRFWRTVRRAAREAYDYLGTVLALSGLIAVAAVVVVPGAAAAVLALQGARGAALARAFWRGEAAPAGQMTPGDVRACCVAFVLAAIVGWTLLGPLLSGVYRYVRLIVAREDPAPADMFREARRHARAGVALAAAQALVGQVLLVDLLFFLSLPAPAFRWVGMLCFYPLLFWGLMVQYQWPLLAEGAPLAVPGARCPVPGGNAARRPASSELGTGDRAPEAAPQAPGPVPIAAALTAVKKSALLVLDNLPFSLGLGLCGLLFTLLCSITGIGAVLLWAGSLAFLHTVALRELLRKYGLLPPEAVPEDAVDLGYGWHE